MTISTSPQIGSIAYSKSGTAYTVSQVEGDRVTVVGSDGKLKRVPLLAIARWEMPEPEEPPVPPPPIGAIAYGKLGIGYVVTEVDGDRAVLQTSDGKTKAISMAEIYWWEMNPDAKFDLPPTAVVIQDGATWRSQGNVEGCWYSSDTIINLLKIRPNRPEVGDRVVIRNLTACLKRYPRLSLDLQCAVYRVVRVNDDGTVSLTSDYGDARYPVDWVGVLP